MAQGGPKPTSFYVERQAATRVPSTPPTFPTQLTGITSNVAAGQTDPGPNTQTAGDGLVLAGLSAIVVSLWPQTGFTLTGGTLQCWIYSPYQLNWARCTDLDLVVPTGSTYTGPTGFIWGGLKDWSRLGMLANWYASSLTGTSPDFLIRIDGFQGVNGNF